MKNGVRNIFENNISFHMAIKTRWYNGNMEYNICVRDYNEIIIMLPKIGRWKISSI